MIISGKAKPIRLYFNKRHSFEFFLFKNLSNFKRLIFFWYKFMVVTIEKKTHQEIWIHVMIKLYILDQLPITFYSSFRTTYNCVLTYVIHKRMFHKQCVDCYWYDETGERCPVTIQRWRCANGVNMAENRKTTYYQIFNEGFCWQLSEGN